jgi:hypothetical protein
MQISMPVTPEKPSSSAITLPSAVLERLCNTEGSYYIGDTDLASKAKFYIGGVKEGNTLVVQNDESEPTEFLLCGAFEIDKHDFYLVSDGNFFPGNSYGSKFADVKASCPLTPIRRDPSFKFSIEAYPIAVKNIQAIEKKAPIMKDDSITSILYPTTDGMTSMNSIKITHALFQANPYFMSLVPLLIPHFQSSMSEETTNTSENSSAGTLESNNEDGK